MKSTGVISSSLQNAHLRMDDGAVVEGLEVPVDVDGIKGRTDGFIIDPEDAVVVLQGRKLVKVQLCLQLVRPVVRIQMTEGSLPPLVTPGVLDLK